MKFLLLAFVGLLSETLGMKRNFLRAEFQNGQKSGDELEANPCGGALCCLAEEAGADLKETCKTIHSQGSIGTNNFHMSFDCKVKQWTAPPPQPGKQQKDDCTGPKPDCKYGIPKNGGDAGYWGTCTDEDDKTKLKACYDARDQYTRKKGLDRLDEC